MLTGLLPTPSSLQIGGLSAAGRRQIFASGLAEQARKAEEAQLVLQQPLRHKVSPVLPATAPRALQAAELCTEAAWGTERTFTWPQRSLHAMLPWEAPRETAATPEVPGQKAPTSPTVPHQGRAVTLLTESPI